MHIDQGGSRKAQRDFTVVLDLNFEHDSLIERPPFYKKALSRDGARMDIGFLEILLEISST